MLLTYTMRKTDKRQKSYCFPTPLPACGLCDFSGDFLSVSMQIEHRHMIKEGIVLRKVQHSTCLLVCGEDLEGFLSRVFPNCATKQPQKITVSE